MFYISVLYHRGLAHRSVKLGPHILKILEKTGFWVTGLDPVSWVLMHRIHHLHSDDKHDPHSPLNGGIFSVWMSQYRSYLYFQERMRLKDNSDFNSIMKDVPFGISKTNSNLPYLLHILIALALTIVLQNWFAGIGYFLGMMGHPIQGWLINSVAHYYGSRNFETPDNSKNNFWLALFIFGEGYQNNHHAHPNRANFAVKFPEFDPGYLLCLIAAKLKIIQLQDKSC